MNKNRIRLLQKGIKKKGFILYWMSRDQRFHDNWALIYAQKLALKKKEPLVVIFSIITDFLQATLRHFDFLLINLKKVKEKCTKANIPFILLEGNPSDTIPRFLDEYDVSNVIIDFSPLKIKKQWIDTIKSKIEIPLFEVDAHNIVPCWKISQKQEYAAYTIRPKIKENLSSYLEDFPEVRNHPYTVSSSFPNFNFEEITKNLKTDNSVNPISWLSSGEEYAKKILNEFIHKKIKSYLKFRNNPNKDVLSNLSPYLHFGQISSQRVVLELSKKIPISDLKNTFFDEIIVRKELSDNFCYFNENYDSFEGFPHWARKTLNSHRDDKREYIYSLDELEKGKTHDDVWNAAQSEMIKKGKMHGYLRMYWAKKILEWTETPEDALNYTILLNNKYEIDGNDPNGYVGIAWAIGGVHDRAWKERPIYGKVRYMSYNGLKRKFNIDTYISKNTI
jgi:deoxyribodipyrimidine photo-lyase